ncbi:MAG: hypothetical protein ACXVPF_09035 [Bacteroidia bacterium]
MINAFALLLMLFAFSISAQNAKPAPCSSPEAAQFDFWLGDWNLTYNDTAHAFNSITKEMGTCVIHEHFKDPKAKYFGESWSVYNQKTKKWQQTWVDDQGAYIALTGVFENNKMTLYTEPTIDAAGKRTQYRMLYHNITPEKFDWKWELTNDDGKTWKANWEIHYTRVK